MISNIFGYAGTLVAVIGFQLKKQSKIIIFQFLANLLVALSYLALGGTKMAGGAVCFVASIQTFINYLYFRKDNSPPKIITVVSLFVYVAVSAVTVYLSGNMTVFYAWIPLLGSIIYMAAVSTQNSTLTRFLFLLNMLVWITYDVISQPIAVANLVTHICILISILLGIFRYDLRQKTK